MTQQDPQRQSPSPFSPARKVQLAGVLLALLAAAYTSTAVDYGIGLSDGTVEAGVLPFVLGIVLFVLSIALVAFPGEPRTQDEADRLEIRRRLGEAARFFVAFVGYVALVTLIGFPVGTAIGVPLTLRFVFGYSWGRAIVAGLLMAGLGYALFDTVLGVQLP